jgi:shikimate kinase
MRSILCGAMLALAITTARAEEVDKNSANIWLPSCKASVEMEASAPPRGGSRSSSAGSTSSTAASLPMISRPTQVAPFSILLMYVRFTSAS